MIQRTERFKALEEHENEIEFLRVSEARKNNKIEDKNLQLIDFWQGCVGNCGMMAALGALSLRPEFSSKIAPLIDHPKGLLHFKMFCEGAEVRVTVDDRLFFQKTEKRDLAYAASLRNDEQGRDLVGLSSFFEKAYVKQTCFKDYLKSECSSASFVFSCFSNSMTNLIMYDADESKETLTKHLQFEIGNNSSVVLGFTPNIYYPVDSENDGHFFTVIGYNEQEKAVKLYDPFWEPGRCVSSKSLPPSLTMDADDNNGELWLALKDVDQREVELCSLHSEKMYKSAYQVNKKISLSDFDENNFARLDICKITLRQTSKLMFNLFSYCHEFEDLDITVRADDDEKKEVELDEELPSILNSLYCDHHRKGEPMTQYNQRFQLQPNVYIISLELSPLVEDQTEENLNLLLRIGSFEECTFESLNVKAE